MKKETNEVVQKPAEYTSRRGQAWKFTQSDKRVYANIDNPRIKTAWKLNMLQAEHEMEVNKKKRAAPKDKE